jgi:hypothetical protein
LWSWGNGEWIFLIDSPSNSRRVFANVKRRQFGKK